MSTFFISFPPFSLELCSELASGEGQSLPEVDVVEDVVKVMIEERKLKRTAVYAESIKIPSC